MTHHHPPQFNVQGFKYYSLGVFICCSVQGKKLLTIYMNGVLSIFFKLYF